MPPPPLTSSPTRTASNASLGRRPGSLSGGLYGTAGGMGSSSVVLGSSTSGLRGMGSAGGGGISPLRAGSGGPYGRLPAAPAGRNSSEGVASVLAGYSAALGGAGGAGGAGAGTRTTPMRAGLASTAGAGVGGVGSRPISRGFMSASTGSYVPSALSSDDGPSGSGSSASLLAQSLPAHPAAAGGGVRPPSMGGMHLRHGSAGGARPVGAGEAGPSFSCTVLQSAGRTSSRPLQLAYGSGCTQGYRPTMEDEHINMLGARSVDGNPVSLFAILDGHCGRRVADLGGQRLPEQLFSHPSFGNDNARAMVEAVMETDRQIFQTIRTQDGGATLIFAVIHKRMLYVGCLGDARAVLCDNGATVPMSIDHKPTDPQEQARIVRCGGFVHFGRVSGCLAVSRALGDFEFKVALGRFQQKEFQVSNVADIRQINLTDASRFLILACDGLWDVMSSEEAVAWVTDFLARNEAALARNTSDTLNRCSQTLCEAAVTKGSTDNVSVTVVLFHAPTGASAGADKSLDGFSTPPR